MIRKPHFLLALALAAAAIGVPVAHAAVKSPYEYLGHPTSQGGVDRVSAAAVKSPYEYLGHPTSQGGVSLVATAATGRPIDPLAVGYLIGQGYTPSQIHAWTVGACSHQVKPDACFGPSRGANLTDGAVKVDPLAVGYLIGQGLSPSEVTAWTVGACSHQTKAPSCYAMLEPASTSSPQVAGSTGFQWGDAVIGAGFTLGIVLLLGGAGAGLLISRRNGGRQAARA
jgi:hypothetical protein